MRSVNATAAPAGTGISRRTLVKGAAWSVPVLMIATPAPAFAASGCNPTFTLDGTSYKCPGQGQNVKQYYLDICVSNTSGCSDPSNTAPTAVYIWGVQNQSGKGLIPAGGATWPINIELTGGAGCSGLTEFVWPAGESGSSANGLYFWYNFDADSSTEAKWSGKVDSPPNGTDQQCGSDSDDINGIGSMSSVLSMDALSADTLTGTSDGGHPGSAEGGVAGEGAGGGNPEGGSSDDISGGAPTGDGTVGGTVGAVIGGTVDGS